MERYGEVVLRSLSETVLCELEPAPSQALSDACGDFVVCFYQSSQPLIRLVLAILCVVFNFAPLLRYGKTYLHCTRPHKAAQSAKWRLSAVSVKRDLVKLVRTLVIISYYDHESVTDRLGIDRTTYLENLSFYTGYTPHD